MTQTVVLLADQPVATLRALGVSRVVSQSEWVEPGSRVRIGATEEKPERDETIFVGARRLQWFRDPDDEWWLYDGATCQSAPLPLGVVVGTAVVAACVRLGACNEGGEHVCLVGDDALHHSPLHEPFPDGETERVFQGARPFIDAALPWALMLDDAKPVSARCPACMGKSGDDLYCSLCGTAGVVDDPGASGLRVEEWTP